MRALVGAGTAVAAAGVGAAVVRGPVLAVVLVVGLAVLAATVLRLEWAVLAYVAAEPFGDLLTGLSPSSMKLVGVVLFAAWLVRLVTAERAPALRQPVVVAVGCLVLVLLASAVVSGVPATGTEVLGRYLSYLGVLVVLVDTMRHGLAPLRVAAVFAASCTAAAVVGLGTFLAAEDGRASGPMNDPNDFAFYLVCALPFAVVLWRRGGRDRHLWAGAAVLLLLATLATFSRGALLAVVVMLVVASVLGLLRVRHLAVGAAALGVLVALVVVLGGGLVQRSLEEKQHVADANIDSRFTTWTMAAQMTADRPLLGQGPGGYRAQADQYVPAGVTDTTHAEVPHQMYLDVASELGLVGLAAFLAVIGAGLVGAGRAARSGDALGTAVCVSTAGVLVAACFLSEQYYLPVWLVAGLGAALAPREVAR